MQKGKMKKRRGKHDDSPPITDRIRDLESKIRTLENEERMWKDREVIMTDLISDREKEIQALRNILHLMYDKKNKPGL